MKTLASSYVMFRPYKYRVKDTVSGLSFLGHQKQFSVNISFSSQNKYCQSISSVPHDTQTTNEDEIHQIIHTNQQKMVHIRFQLRKECAFGQQFLVVGDDPIIGLWEPSDGVPLIWSDGHLWTAEVDLPIGKEIKYKFVLKEESGSISWQLGADRFLETWDTEKTINVFEDWDNPELQEIAESALKEEILVSSDLAVVDENLSVLVTDEWTNVNEELDTDGNNSIEEKAPARLVAENIVGRELDWSNSDNNEIIGVGSDNETRLITYEGVPVLVPGLISTASEDIKEVPISEVETEHDKSTISNMPSVLASEVEREHDENTTSDVLNVLVREVKREHEESTTTGAPNVLVSEVEIEHEESTTSDVPNVLASEVEIEHEETTTSDVTSVLVSEVEIEHEEIINSELPNVFVSEVEREHDESTTSIVPNEVEELDVTKLKDEHVSASLDSTKTSQEMVDKGQEEEKRVLDSVMEGDKQWGRQTLQKFLASLGFQLS